MMENELLQNCPLGKETPYLTKYEPSLLFPIPRSQARNEIPIPSPIPFIGADIWYAYELSWLNLKGKPSAAIAEIIFPCASPHLIESKSLKIYLHSFNQTQFATVDEVQQTIQRDLSASVGAPVSVKVFMPRESQQFALGTFEGICLDDLDVSIEIYDVDPSLLKTGSTFVEESLYSNLLKSNCLVTNQPDWGHVFIYYKGKKIDHDSLLKYIVSYRDHQGFHEECIERMFMDIMKICKPEKLTIYGRYTRRGGLDINPFRSNWEKSPTQKNLRLYRQ